MTTETVDADSRAQTMALLSRYPDVSAHELDLLHHWFRRVAGPLDVGLLASDPAMAQQYRAYRDAHIDRFSARDIVLAALFVGVVACVVGLIVMMVP